METRIQEVSESHSQARLLAKSKNLAYDLRDITDCDKEPLAFCGAVQSFGLMLVADYKSRTIQAASDNWASVLGGMSSDDLLGLPLSQVLDLKAAGDAQDIDHFCSLIATDRSGHTVVGKGGDLCDLIQCYRSGESVVFEFERKNDDAPQNAISLVKDLVFHLRDATTIEYCCKHIAEGARDFSDYDRVMVYRFDENNDGEVIAEARREDLEPFLHLKYPASDIPVQARQLFLKNHTRVIADTRAEAVPLLSREFRPGTIDLSASFLRAVSPIHLVYLENMGVRASFSVPIRVGNKLWGLVACHQYSGPRHPSRQVRSAFELASQILSGRLGELVERRRLQIKSDTLLFTQTLLNDVARGIDILSSFESAADRLLRMTDSTSAFVRIGGRHLLVGKPIEPDTLEKLLFVLREKDHLGVWKCNALKEELNLKQTDIQAAGALAVPLSLGFEDLLIWFRPEVAAEVRWGGRPKEREGEPSATFERLMPRSSFSEWIELVKGEARPWHEGDEECAQFFLFGFVQEIFARTQTLSLAFKELERVTKAKDEFISTVSHELRTPLGVIIGWIDILKDYPQEFAEARQAIEIIERNAKTQVALIDDLLDVSRIISGKMRIETQEGVNVNGIVNSVVDGARPAAIGKQLKLAWEPSGRILISADPDRLRQMVWNLLSNAIKFTPKGGTINVRTSIRDSSAVIEIEDNGVGIAAEQLHAIFNRFVQADSDAVKAGGLGLGLSIVKGLAEAHGGSVAVFSPGKNQGAIFSITLPIFVLAPGELKPKAESGATLRKSDLFKGLKVLIAEDQLEAQLALRILCERNGATVHVTATGSEALGYLQQNPVDLILSDIGMPDMDGYDFMKAWRIEELRRGMKPIPAIALTAYASSKDRTKALEAGFMSHIPKPVDRAELLAVINSLHLGQQS